MKHQYVIHWESWLVSGNEKVNPDERFFRETLCAGYLSVIADSESSARKEFHKSFPDDKILKVL